MFTLNVILPAVGFVEQAMSHVDTLTLMCRNSPMPSSWAMPREDCANLSYGRVNYARMSYVISRQLVFIQTKDKYHNPLEFCLVISSIRSTRCPADSLTEQQEPSAAPHPRPVRHDNRDENLDAVALFGSASIDIVLG